MAGIVARSAETSTVLPVPVGVLNTPTSFAIGTPGSTTLPVTWTAPVQGTAIGYKVYQTSDLVTPLATVAWPSTGTTVVGLDASTSYTLHVVTYDSAGESTASNTDTASTVAAAAWQLDAANYISTAVTGMTPTITFPRPNTETGTYAYCRNAYPSMAWEIPIVVQGGSWPFKYQLVKSDLVTAGVEGTDYPTGMSIGETLTPSGDVQIVGAAYGSLSWPVPTGTTETIYVLVTDQNGNKDTVEITIAIGTANFVFLDSTALNDSGTGAIGSPLKTIPGADGTTGLWRNSDTNNDFVNKIAVFRTGSYEASADGVNKMTCDPTYKPMTYIAYPGQVVNFDMTVSRIWLEGDDVFFGDIDFDGSAGSNNNYHLYLIGTGSTDRATFFRTTHDNLTPGSLNNDNPSAIQARGISVPTTATLRSYLSVVRCTSKVDVTVALYIGFNTDYCVLELNESLQTTIEAGNGSFFLKAKDQHPNLSMRANKAIALTTMDGDIYSLSEQTLDDDIINQECCYNVGYCTDTLSGITNPVFLDGGSNPGAGWAENVHFYRNTGVHTHARGLWSLESASGDLTQLHNNVFYGGTNDIYNIANDGIFFDSIDDILANTIGWSLGTEIDTSGKLVDTATINARTNYLGTHGHEVLK